MHGRHSHWPSDLVILAVEERNFIVAIADSFFEVRRRHRRGYDLKGGGRHHQEVLMSVEYRGILNLYYWLEGHCVDVEASDGYKITFKTRSSQRYRG